MSGTIFKARIDTNNKKVSIWYKKKDTKEHTEMVSNADLNSIPDTVPRFEFASSAKVAGIDTTIIIDNLEIWK